MAQMNESMDVDKPQPNASNKTNDSKPKDSEYELSVQLVMHNSPARCVVAIDNDTIISGGRKNGEFISWKRMNSNQNNSSNENNDNTNIEEDDDDTKMKEDISAIKFDGSFIFSNDTFHPLTFCAVKYKLKSDTVSPRICSGGSDQRAVIWDIDGNIVQQLSGHSNSVNSVDVTDDGDVITGSYDSTAKIWDSSSGKCKSTLEGHQHGVEVCSLQSGEIVTGTFKLFHIWDKNGQLIKTNKSAHDHMIRKVRRHPLGFLTAGNDGYVNLWTNTGESIKKVLAHPENGDIPSFVYGLYCKPSGEWLSCGEDGTVKIFSADGFLQQSLRHPGAVWDIDMLPNGDIISACADGAVRIWTKDVQRIADTETVNEYYKMLTMTAQAQSSQQVSNDQLEPYEVLSSPGKAGEFKMVNDPKKGPSVYQWDGQQQKWEYIGEIMGKPNTQKQARSANNKPMIDGVEFDYVTHIDINGDNVQVPLGFNRDDDPRQIARDFCVIHSIDLDLAFKIEEHLKPMMDPVARAQRLERERIAASKQLRHIPSFRQCEYEIYSKCKLDLMKKKILSINEELMKEDKEEKNEFCVKDVSDFDALFDVMSDQTVWHVAKFPDFCMDLIENKLLKWPSNKVLAVLDVVRMLMLHQDAVDKLITNNENMRNLILSHIGNDDACNGSMQMIVSRLLSNYLAKRKRSKEERMESKYPKEILEFLQEALSLMSSAATNKKTSVHIAYIMFAHNLLIWFAKFQIEECDLYLVVISAVFEMVTELEMNEKILYYALSLIGTCAWASKQAKQSIIEIFDDQLKSVINKAKNSKQNSACAQVGNDLWNLFEMK